MFRWFRESKLDPLSVSMAGAKLGDRVLVIGCRDPHLIAALAIKAGLTGRGCAVDDSEERVREAERVALREGALSEATVAPLHSLQYEQDSFDLVLLRHVVSGLEPEPRLAVLEQAQRVLRPGGRCMVIDSTVRPGRVSLFSSKTAAGASADPEALSVALKARGFVAVRVLAEREGLVFVEGVKRTP
jgi:ubiquinone/menaquinone biosynthesis C-methylase UbiE